MVAGSPPKNQFAFASDTQNRTPFVVGVCRITFQQPLTLRAINKFHSAVVFQAPSLPRRVRNRYSRILRSAQPLEKKLMLLRL